MEASSTSANSSQTWEKANDQIDRFCCLRLSPHNLSTGNDSCAGSRAGRHDHASRLRLRPVQDTSWWCLRRQDHHPPCAPRSPQVCAMARRRLRSVGLLKRLAASKLDGKLGITGNSTPDITPLGSINRARQPAEFASRKARPRGFKAHRRPRRGVIVAFHVSR